MRGRGGKRGRGRPARPQFHSRAHVVNRNIFIKKPVYLQGKDDEVRGSRSSTPGIGGEVEVEEENSFSGSRSSSVTRSSFGPSLHRKKKAKKTEAGSSSQLDPTQEYYYGSDFENLSEGEEQGADANDSDSESEPRSVYNADELLSESELSLPSSAGAAHQDYVPVSRPPTPVPVWLQDREIPKLVLPPSSDDLLIPRQHILQTCAVYEVLRHFRTQIFISPFTLEDFSAALLAPEQSMLLSEVHYQMLRLLLREDEKQQVQFGPQDHKDSINSVLYMCDIVTWPETLRIFLSTLAGGRDKGIQEAVTVLENHEYPFVPFEERLKVLQVMTDLILVTPLVRNEFQREGPIVYDDHCRACHRLGDLLCCETCPATYHLDCVVPPLSQVPDHDWQCEVCRKHQVKGVTDCVSDMERNGAMNRQEVLGHDRQGRRYWFLCRRLFIEDPAEPGSVIYYSTPAQYAELLSRLDRSDLEDALCMSLQELHYDIQRQMKLTEEMTEQRLRAGRKSYLQAQTDGSTSAGGGGDAAGSAAAEPGEPPGVTPSGDADTTAEKEGGTVETETRRLPGGQTLMITRTKSGSLPAKVEKDEEGETNKSAPLFRLGDDSDRTYQKYDNQYASNPLALNRFQAAEDKDKRRHMSHKFSMTAASEFEWKGNEFGSRAQLRASLRQTLQELVARLPSALMHPSWPQLRRAWNGAVAGSTRPQDFARALTVIAALIKPRLLCTVWNDSIAHVTVQRITAAEREERKKVEKREKRENAEEEVAAMRVPFVKYHVKKVKHQVWKQRGEEYRIHGLAGWRWLSRTRRYRSGPAASTVGLSAGPHRVYVHTAAGEGRPARTISLPAAEYKRQLQTQQEAGGPGHSLLTVRLQLDPADPDREPEEVPVEPVVVQQLLTDGVVDVSAGLRAPSRRLFPRSARLAKLDKLLPWREELDQLDRGDDDSDTDDGSDDLPSAAASKPGSSSSSVTAAADGTASDRKPGGTVSDKVVPKSEVKTEIKTEVKQELERQLKEKKKEMRLLTRYSCYSPTCRAEGREQCFSPACRRAVALSGEISELRLKIAIKQEIKDEPMDDDEKKSSKSAYYRRPLLESISTEEPFKLTVIKPVPKKNYVKYPLFSKFRAGGRWSMLVLPTWELRQIARRRGIKVVEGFNYTAKNNWQVWPYPCPRAALRTGWLFRTCSSRSLHAAGLQLRSLWACIRWDDIDSRPQQVAPGEFQITTDTGMVRSLVLKHRDEGRFKERTMYYRRRVTILFDNPVIVEKEYTSSARSGLRKRRRVIENSENPTSAVTEEWVPEDQLEIFEIKYYHEKLERQRQERQQALLAKRAALQSSRASSPATTAAAAPAPASPGTPKGKPGAAPVGAQLKAKLEEAGKLGRAMGKGTKFMVKPSTAGNPGSQGNQSNPATPQRTYTAMRKIITKDGKVIAIQSNPAVTPAPGAAAAGSPRAATPSTPLQMASPTVQVTTSVAAGPVSPTKPAAPPAARANQIQIIKLPDGKLQVKGLKPGQQLVQLPSGQLQLVSGGTAKSLQAVTKPPPSAPAPAPTPAPAAPTAPSTPRLRLVTSTPTAEGGVPGATQVPAPTTVQVTSPVQRVVQKMVTQVVDIGGLTKPQLLAWQQKINDGKAKLALVNGRRVILHNVLVNQTVTGDAAPVSATSTPAKQEATLPADAGESGEEDDPVPLNEEEEEEEERALREVKTEPEEVAEEKPEVEEKPEEKAEVKTEAKSELTPGRQITATANIVQTPAGPRVVIQGVPTQGLSQSQLHNLQQQVKAELAKGPMLTGLREIHLTVPADVPEVPVPAPPPAAVAVVQSPVQSPTAAQQPRVRSLSQRSLLSPRRVSESGATQQQQGEETAAAAAIAEDFTVTQEYIQQSINNALNSDNLKPEIAEKLLQLRKKPAAGAADPAGTAPAPAPGGDHTAAQAEPAQPPKKRPKADRPRVGSGPGSTPSSVRAPKRGTSERRPPRPSTRLLQLSRRKEQLKREILRKRLQMENHLQLQISKQLTALKKGLQAEKAAAQPKKVKKDDSGTHRRGSGHHRSKSESEPTSGRKRKSSTSRAPSSGRHKKARKDSGAAAAGKDSKKLHCICRQPYDSSKFYVGCDMCSNWYHGSCVGISQRSSKKMKAYTCQQCLSAKENRELFCFCRTEYDESQFYIGCDRCEDWFHGRCVGILPSEGDEIDDYLCPRCAPQAPINRPNFSPLTERGYSELKRVFKQIKNNKNAWPFVEPVDPEEVPSYYKVIKEPMDLQTMENRLDSRHYGRLCDFTGDMIVVLDNCKYFNPPGTRLATCGVNLEAFFRAELKKLRNKL